MITFRYSEASWVSRDGKADSIPTAFRTIYWTCSELTADCANLVLISREMEKCVTLILYVVKVYIYLRAVSVFYCDMLFKLILTLFVNLFKLYMLLFINIIFMPLPGNICCKSFEEISLVLNCHLCMRAFFVPLLCLCTY